MWSPLLTNLRNTGSDLFSSRNGEAIRNEKQE